jgi:hypothetical protein
MRDPSDLRTLETLELLPVDLNSLLYHAEQTIAALRRLRGRAGDAEIAARFTAAAANRRRALLAAAYDPASAFFYDVRWRNGERMTDRPTLAAAAPLYFGLATPAQGRAVAARLERDFLNPGGFVTTLVATGQQWDAPNGWPPLEWLAIEGVRRYGRGDLADLARARWLALNRRIYHATGKMTEKYDVVDVNRRAGGGEYPTQDGFGWSNGVALALAAQEGDDVFRWLDPCERALGAYSDRSSGVCRSQHVGQVLREGRSVGRGQLLEGANELVRPGRAETPRARPEVFQHLVYFPDPSGGLHLTPPLHDLVHQPDVFQRRAAIGVSGRGLYEVSTRPNDPFARAALLLPGQVTVLGYDLHLGSFSGPDHAFDIPDEQACLAVPDGGDVHHHVDLFGAEVEDLLGLILLH